MLVSVGCLSFSFHRTGAWSLQGCCGIEGVPFWQHLRGTESNVGYLLSGSTAKPLQIQRCSSHLMLRLRLRCSQNWWGPCCAHLRRPTSRYQRRRSRGFSNAKCRWWVLYTVCKRQLPRRKPLSERISDKMCRRWSKSQPPSLPEPCEKSRAREQPPLNLHAEPCSCMSHGLELLLCKPKTRAWQLTHVWGYDFEHTKCYHETQAMVGTTCFRVR